jgi:hypothetical protein
MTRLAFDIAELNRSFAPLAPMVFAIDTVVAANVVRVLLNFTVWSTPERLSISKSDLILMMGG